MLKVSNLSDIFLKQQYWLQSIQSIGDSIEKGYLFYKFSEIASPIYTLASLMPCLVKSNRN